MNCILVMLYGVVWGDSLLRVKPFLDLEENIVYLYGLFVLVNK